jgi:superfamily II DNA helicase RecQ
VARFPALRVGKLLAVYLQYVVPFHRMINGNWSLTENAFLFGDHKGPWQTDAFTKVLKSKAGKALGWEMTLQQYRHFILAVERKHIRPDGTRESMEGEDSDSDMVDNPWDQGAGHSSSIAVKRYAREMGFTRTLNPETIGWWSSMSKGYHKFYDLISVESRAPTVKGDLSGLLTQKERESEIVRIMTGWYGAGYVWKSPQQKEATERIVEGVSPLFVILPTAAGKTTSFLLPAKMKGAKTTVIITPLVALGSQLKSSCIQMGLDVEIFVKGRARKARVVIVVTETAGTEDFKEFVMELQLNKQLDRVVWDEAHMLVNDQSYRLAISGSSSLQLKCQLVFVTATCPPSMVEEIAGLMVLPTPYVVRQDYWKLNFRYSVSVCQDLEQSARSRIQGIMGEVSDDAKILVFCKTGGEVMKWAKEYKGRKYHSRLREKAEEWEQWRNGLMFATTAIGAGMDKAGIERVLHIGDPYTLMGYVQESGRGGRGGDYVEAMVLVEAEEYERLMSIPRKSLTKDDAAKQDYLRGNTCRNEVLTGFLNGRGQTCVDIDAPLCDFCTEVQDGRLKGTKRRQEALVEELKRVSKRQKSWDSQAFMKQQSVVERIEMWERIEAALKEIGSCCPVCWFLKDVEWAKHELRTCEMWRELFGKENMGSLRREYLDYSSLKTTCWTCGLPGDRCEAYSNRRGRCGSHNCILPVVLYFWMQYDSEYNRVVRGVLGREIGDLKELGMELVKKTRILEENGSVAFKIWVEIFKQRVMG